MNRIVWIFVALAVVAGVVWWTEDEGLATEPGRTAAPALPALAAGVNDAAAVVIERDDARVELRREGDEWRLASMGGYPARFEPVRELLVELARLADPQPRTANPERHAKLQVAAEGEGAGTRVRVEAADGAVLEDVWIGRSNWSPRESVYFRREGEDQVWLAAGGVRPSASARTWFDAKLVSLPADDVDRVVVAGDVDVVLARGEDGVPAPVEGVPEGRELASPNPFDALFRQLANATFDDVRAVGEAPVDGDPFRSLRFETEHGGAVELALWREADGTGGERLWATLRAEPGTVAPPVGPVLAPDESAPAEGEETPPVAEPVISRERADGWNAAWEPWVFRLPTWTGTALAAGWDAWLAEPVEEEPVEEEPDEDEPDASGDVGEPGGDALPATEGP